MLTACSLGVAPEGVERRSGRAGVQVRESPVQVIIAGVAATSCTQPTSPADETCGGRGAARAVVSDPGWQPTTPGERHPTLDVLRGVALFGVLLINLHTLFRVSLFDHILHFHTHAGRWNHLVDVLLAGFLETKAVPLFSLAFGIGAAIQHERATASGVNAMRFLGRRYLVLLWRSPRAFFG